MSGRHLNVGRSLATISPTGARSCRAVVLGLPIIEAAGSRSCLNVFEISTFPVDSDALTRCRSEAGSEARPATFPCVSRVIVSPPSLSASRIGDGSGGGRIEEWDVYGEGVGWETTIADPAFSARDHMANVRTSNADMT